MAENETAPSPSADIAGSTDANDGPKFAAQKIYLKDVSFESPGAPAIFQEANTQPELKLNLNQRVQGIGENVYEVVLTVTVTCKIGDKTAYLAEVQQAGIFGLADFDEEQLQATLGAYCPTILFPYARQQISDLVLHGGFQPLLLQPVNFDQLYLEQMRKRKEEAAPADA